MGAPEFGFVRPRYGRTGVRYTVSSWSVEDCYGTLWHLRPSSLEFVMMGSGVRIPLAAPANYKYFKKINHSPSSSFFGPTFRPTPGRDDPNSGCASERDAKASPFAKSSRRAGVNR
jgi:hypothetical protein